MCSQVFIIVMDMSCYMSHYSVTVKSHMNGGIDWKQIPSHGQYIDMLLILWFSRYRLLKLLGVDTLIIFMKRDFCSTKYGQSWFSAELGSGICMALQCGAVGRLEAARASTLTPQLAVPLSRKRARAEQSSCAWEVCESGMGEGEGWAGLGSLFFQRNGRRRRIANSATTTWTAGAVKANSRVPALSNIGAAGKMRVRNRREIPSYTQDPLKS